LFFAKIVSISLFSLFGGGKLHYPNPNL